MTVPWNVGDVVIRVGQPDEWVIESFRREIEATFAIVRMRHGDDRREIRIDITTPVLYRKIG